MTWSCFFSGSSGEQILRLPDIPRWMMRCWFLGRAMRMYLALRETQFSLARDKFLIW